MRIEQGTEEGGLIGFIAGVAPINQAGVGGGTLTTAKVNTRTRHPL